ncbi:Uncharacterised protein [Chlamydia abortus]|uniref:Uncharacterized protein n=1 Tax=Paenibacillus residui TaxID=629724 RepID=A0ABW3D781_9BACL|nr:Uncharacterised protein [Chlamydia abortus]
MGKSRAMPYSKAIMQVFMGKGCAMPYSKAIMQVFMGKGRHIPYSKAIIHVFGAIFAKSALFVKKTCTFERLSPSFWKKAGF